MTSGWDVFDPDDQIENTIPTAHGNGGADTVPPLQMSSSLL